MLLVQKWPFFQLFFFRHYRPGKCVSDILKANNTFLAYIKEKFKKLKQLTFFHAFVPKMAIFPTFNFEAIQPWKMCFTIFQNHKTPFQAIKTKSSKSQKIDIFPCFWSKNGHFSNFVFLGKIGRENVVYHILEPKKIFLGQKNTKFKKSKN